jgi:hypothetical protein
LVQNQFHISFIIRENKQYRDYFLDYPGKFFTVYLYYVTVDNTVDPNQQPVITRKVLPLSKCPDVIAGGFIRRGNFTSKAEAFGAFSNCFTFDKEDVLEGSMGERTFKYAEMRIEPCRETENDCLTKTLFDKWDSLRQNPPKASMALAHSRFLNLTFEIGIVDSMMNLGNYTSPLNYTVTTEGQITLQLEQQLRQDFLISQINVTTNAGVFWRTQNNVTRLTYQKQIPSYVERMTHIKTR